MGDSNDQNSVGKNKQLLRPPPGFELKINDNLPMSSREKIQVDTNFIPGYYRHYLYIKKKVTVSIHCQQISNLQEQCQTEMYDCVMRAVNGLHLNHKLCRPIILLKRPIKF